MPRYRKYKITLPPNQRQQAQNQRPQPKHEELYKKSANVIITPEDDEEQKLNIKPAKFMQNPKDTMWYMTGEEDDNLDPNKIVDNNEYVNLDTIQRPAFAAMEASTKPERKVAVIPPSQIKQAIKEEQNTRVAEIGEYIVMFRNKIVAVCSDNFEVLSKCNDILKDDNCNICDIIILHRISVEDILSSFNTQNSES